MDYEIVPMKCRVILEAHKKRKKGRRKKDALTLYVM
jgi:hypothetical protein